MRATFLVATVAGLAMTVFAQNVAGENEVRYDSSGCKKSERIPHAEATCLTASWSKYKGSMQFYTFGGHEFRGTNHCADWGAMRAHVDLKRWRDAYMFLETDEELKGGTSMDVKVRQISCCITKEAKLCYKDQVDRHDTSGGISNTNLIRYKKTKDHSAFRDVGTHENRWSFCEEDPDYIYCEVDPEGDAFVKPDSVIATEAMVAELEAAAETTDCDGAACTVQDCVDAFEDSDAASTGLCGAGSLTTDGYGTLCSPHYLSERGNVNCVGTAVLDVDNNCGQNLTAFCKQPNGLRGTEKVWPSWGASSDGITVRGTQDPEVVREVQDATWGHALLHYLFEGGRMP